MAEESLFNRLTKLFRSGPTIKRKVRKISKSDSNSSAIDLFKKHHSDVYNSTLAAYGSFDRMARYSDFGEMESTPEIASALDIYAEETVSEDSEGQVLHVYSENRKIKELLETLFYDTLNVNFNMVMWVRNLCKYGDFFLFNDVHPEFGVTNAYPIPIAEIEREEGFDPDDPSATRFRWLTQGNTVLENWQISHFRLLGNDTFLPYGSSVLESARRIWRQLILVEDAMLVYRVIRSPDRRVFYIDVGNVPPEDVANYLEQAKSSLKKNMVIDRSSGQVDLRYNPLSVDEDYFIPVRGGDSGTKIENLSGGTNSSAIEDVEYIQKKLFAALKVPKAYLGYDEDIGSKATLAQEDIRFSRTIQRIQKTIISELNKLAMIHLYSHGFEGEELLDFNLNLSNPSSLAQSQKLELINQRFTIAGTAPEGLVSRAWIRKNVMGLSSDDIDRIEEEKLKDKLEDLKLEGTALPGGGDDTPADDTGGDDAGDLFAADTLTGQLLNDTLPVKTSNSLKEIDEEEEEEDLDEIDLENIVNTSKKISADSRVKLNSFGEPIKKSRKVKYGPADLEMPDLKTMVLTGKAGRAQDSLNDPYDKDFIRSAFKESLVDTLLIDELPNNNNVVKGYSPSLDLNTRKMLEKMSAAIGSKEILKEDLDKSLDFEYEIGDILLENDNE